MARSRAYYTSPAQIVRGMHHLGGAGMSWRNRPEAPHASRVNVAGLVGKQNCESVSLNNFQKFQRQRARRFLSSFPFLHGGYTDIQQRGKYGLADAIRFPDFANAGG